MNTYYLVYGISNVREFHYVPYALNVSTLYPHTTSHGKKEKKKLFSLIEFVPIQIKWDKTLTG